MKTATGPADTRMMGIVYGALRRDLLRTCPRQSASSRLVRPAYGLSPWQQVVECHADPVQGEHL